MMPLFLISIISIVKTMNIHADIDQISKNTKHGKMIEEKCILCGKHGTTVSEEIRLRNLTHLYRGRQDIKELSMINS